MACVREAREAQTSSLYDPSAVMLVLLARSCLESDSDVE